jgi:hypothetical protein
VTNVDGSNALTGVACPTTTLCVAVDAAGNAVTSTNPGAGASAWSVSRIDSAHALTGVSCAAAGLCVAVNAAGGVLTSSNPTADAGAWTMNRVDGSNILAGVACPSAGLCVVVDQFGNVITGATPTPPVPSTGAREWGGPPLGLLVVTLGAVASGVALLGTRRRCSSPEA